MNILNKITVKKVNKKGVNFTDFVKDNFGYNNDLICSYKLLNIDEKTENVYVVFDEKFYIFDTYINPVSDYVRQLSIKYPNNSFYYYCLNKHSRKEIKEKYINGKKIEKEKTL